MPLPKLDALLADPWTRLVVQAASDVLSIGGGEFCADNVRSYVSEPWCEGATLDEWQQWHVLRWVGAYIAMRKTEENALHNEQIRAMKRGGKNGR